MNRLPIFKDALFKTTLIYCLILFSFIACKSPTPLIQTQTAQFKASQLSTAVFSDSVAFHSSFDREACYEGKARISVRTQKNSDSGISEFQICEQSAYYRLKNRLGIEALRIWQKEDSLFIWDLMEKKAYKLRQIELTDPRINALATIDLYDLLHPDLASKSIRLFEDSSRYMAVNNLQQSYIFTKDGYRLESIIQPTEYFNFDRISLSAYGEKNGLRFPTRLELLNSSTETNIFILLQQLVRLEVQPNLRPTIPSSVSFYK